MRKSRRLREFEQMQEIARLIEIVLTHPKEFAAYANTLGGAAADMLKSLLPDEEASE